MENLIPDVASLATPLQIYVACFFVSLISGFVPVVNTEAYLLSVSALATNAAALPVVILATLGQMTAKSVFYLAGRGVLRLPL